MNWHELSGESAFFFYSFIYSIVGGLILAIAWGKHRREVKVFEERIASLYEERESLWKEYRAMKSDRDKEIANLQARLNEYKIERINTEIREHEEQILRLRDQVSKAINPF